MLTRAATLINTEHYQTIEDLIMCKEFSTVIKMGAKAPLFLIMQLTKEERRTFIERVSPHSSDAIKRSVLRA